MHKISGISVDIRFPYSWMAWGRGGFIMQQNLKSLYQKAQWATNKHDRIELLCLDYDTNYLVVTEHGLRDNTIYLFKINN